MPRPDGAADQSPRRRLRHGIAALVALGVLAACAACPPGACRVALTAGPGDGAYVPGALEAAAARFIGPGTGGGTGGLPRLRLDRDTLSPGSDTPHRVAANRGLGVRIEAGHDLTPRSRLLAALEAGAGRHAYLLPEGLGPLTDPMRVRFDTLRLDPALGLAHDIPLAGGARLRLSLMAGHERVRVRTRIASALIALENRHSEGRSHLTLGAGLVLSRGAELHGAARLNAGGPPVWRTGLRLPLRRD